MKHLKTAAISLACLGSMIPHTYLQADNLGQSKTRIQKAADLPVVIDVALTKGGTVSGLVVDSQGTAVDGAIVSIRQGKSEVARTVTDKSGVFVVKNLRGGVYQVVTAKALGAYRFWTPAAAPPLARAKIVIVSQDTVTRGQNLIPFGGVNWITLATVGGGITTLIFSIKNASDLNNIESDVEFLKSKSP